MVVIDSAETDIGAEAPIVPDENMTEENITLDDLDAQNGDDIASYEVETDAESDEAATEAIETEQDVPDPEIESSRSDIDDAFLETARQAKPYRSFRQNRSLPHRRGKSMPSRLIF